VTDVQIDSLGNIYVTGHSVGFIAGNTHSSNVRQRLFVLKYNAAGQLQWAFQYGDRPGQPRFAAGIRLVLDRQTPYIAGVDADALFSYELYRFRDVTSFDSVGSGVRMLLVKLNDNGTLHWRRFWRGNNVGSMPGGLVFAAGHVHLAGQIRNANRDNDLGLFKIRPDGTTAWSRFYSHQDSNSLEFPQALTADSVGNLFVAGHTKFNGQTDYLLLHYRPNGRLGWALTYDAPQGGNDWANDIVYARGHVYATGQSARDLVTLKIRAADGTPVWTQRHNARGTNNSTDTTGYDRPYGVLVDANDNVFVGGVSSVSNQVFFAAPIAQFFLMQYSADGTQQQEYKQLSANFPEAILPFYIYKGITKDTLGNIYMISARGDSTGSNLENPVYNVTWELLKFGALGPNLPDEILDSLYSNLIKNYKYELRSKLYLLAEGLAVISNDTIICNEVFDLASSRGYVIQYENLQIDTIIHPQVWMSELLIHIDNNQTRSKLVSSGFSSTKVNEFFNLINGFHMPELSELRFYPLVYVNFAGSAYSYSIPAGKKPHYTSFSQLMLDTIAPCSFYPSFVSSTQIEYNYKLNSELLVNPNWQAALAVTPNLSNTVRNFPRVDKEMFLMGVECGCWPRAHADDEPPTYACEPSGTTAAGNCGSVDDKGKCPDTDCHPVTSIRRFN
jgi:hypothetical protein